MTMATLKELAASHEFVDKGLSQGEPTGDNPSSSSPTASISSAQGKSSSL